MASREPLAPDELLPPAPHDAWPPPQMGPAVAPPPPRGRLARGVAGLFLGVIGVIGALLPAFDGQKVGDPDSTAFRIGAPLGFVGGVIALVVGIVFVARSRGSAALRAVAIASIVVGGIALLLTLALVLSG